MYESVVVNYSPMSIMVGIGVCAVLCVLAYVFYQSARATKQEVDIDEKYGVMEECAVRKYAASKGFDIDKELLKKTLMYKDKDFRRRIKEEIFDDYFKKKK